MSRAPKTQADEVVRDALARIGRWALIGLGVLIILAGIAISPLPGPGGIPVIVLGLMLVLRNSFWARKQFIKVQKAHPKWVFPIRRLLRREPEVFPVAWQQVLRIERVVLPGRYRMAVKWRRGRKRKAALRRMRSV